MPYKNRQKQLKYVSDWQKRKHPKKYPDGKPRILTADMKEYRKKKRKEYEKLGKPYATPKYYIKKSRELTWRYFKIILNHYGWRCNCCPETNIMFLTADHKDNDGYSDVRESGTRYSGKALYKKIIDEGFPDTYQILCFNCNLGKQRNNGVCPHNIK